MLKKIDLDDVGQVSGGGTVGPTNYYDEYRHCSNEKKEEIINDLKKTTNDHRKEETEYNRQYETYKQENEQLEPQINEIQNKLRSPNTLNSYTDAVLKRAEEGALNFLVSLGKKFR